MISNGEMHVIKRNGKTEDISFDKILKRIKILGQEAGNIQINYSALVMKVIDQLYDKIETTKIDELAAEHCASMSTQHYDYGTLASRIVISNHQKNTNAQFSKVMKQLFQNEPINFKSSIFKGGTAEDDVSSSGHICTVPRSG